MGALPDLHGETSDIQKLRNVVKELFTPLYYIFFYPPSPIGMVVRFFYSCFMAAVYLGLAFSLFVIGVLFSILPMEWLDKLWRPIVLPSKLFDRLKDDVRVRAFGALSKEECSKGFVSGSRNYMFNTDVARLLLLMSSAMYLVDPKKKSNDDVKFIAKAEKEWGLKFELLSDPENRGGPFCGAFIKPGPNPFIVITFKGTTPTDFGEWLTDVTISRTHAEPYLFGRVHTGFYNRLFPDPSTPKLAPYLAILNKVNEIITLHKMEKVQVWVTGHSLGAALASIFYARLIKSLRDLEVNYDKNNFVVRDGYVFGCPNIGDARFASEFASLMNMPIWRSQTLWHVVNDADIVCRVPPGPPVGDNLEFLSHSTTERLDNYTHIGEPIHLHTDGSPPTMLSNRYSARPKLCTVSSNPDKPVLKDPLKTIFGSLIYGVKVLTPTLFFGDYEKKDDMEKLADLLIPTSIIDHFANRDTNKDATNKLVAWLEGALIPTFIVDKLVATADDHTGKLAVWLGRALIPKFIMDHFPHRYYESLEPKSQN